MSSYSVRDGYMIFCRSKNNTDKTIAAKEHSVKKFERWLAPVSLGEAAVKHIEAYRASMAHLKPTTIINELIALRDFYNFLVAAKYIASHPMQDFRIGNAPEPDIKGYRFEDVIPRLLAACRDERERICISLFAAAGPRRGELAGLRWEQFSHDLRRLKVYGKTDKDTGHTIFLSKQMADILGSYKNGAPFVFVNKKNRNRPLREIGLYKIVKGVAKRAGLPGFTCHDFRRTYITHQAANGIPLKVVQKQAGHKRVETTLRYFKVRPDQLEDAAEGIELPVYPLPSK